MNIIFLDVDGVLNNQKYIIGKHDEVLSKYKGKKLTIEEAVDRKMMDIDPERLNLLKQMVDLTSSYVVITSSIKYLEYFEEIKERLNSSGIPVIGATKDSGNDRGKGIINYLRTHDVDKYIILDDDIFEDYNEELLNRLVKTSYYGNGLEEKHIEESIKLMRTR